MLCSRQIDNIGKTRKKVRFNWELFSSFTDVLDDDDEEEEDEDDLEAHRDTIKRLKLADDLTRNMTKEEYMIYSDCRTASFTHRKSKRFREWTNMSTFVDAKPNDDVVDILGFLCYEMVRKITEEALQVKSEMEDTSKNEVKAGGGLFAIQASGRTPLKADHIREAFRRLQMSKNQMKVFRAGLVKTKHRFS
ncbi:hypothetical protein BKA69DRAFT_1058305 [Paraphysoderma sedebokerense]|nr:hypothetical protein BKA69DRAFT_1058305 [Paraphysoderma sedebokerense]